MQHLNTLLDTEDPPYLNNNVWKYDLILVYLAVDILEEILEDEV